MGVLLNIEVEGVDYNDYPGIFDGKGFVYIMTEILGEDPDYLLIKIAKKHNVDLGPFRVDMGEEPEGPWMKPGKLKKAALGLYRAYKAEGDSLIGKEICWQTIEDKDDLKFYRSILYSAYSTCKYAKENGKRVRFVYG